MNAARRRERTRVAAGVAVALGLLLTGACRGGCGCAEAGPPVLRIRDEGAAAGLMRGPEVDAEALAGDPDHDALAVLARDEAGAVRYLLHEDGRWIEETVAEGATGGGLVLTHDPQTREPVAVMVVAEAPDADPLVPALLDAPPEAVAGEGVLLVARRRRPALWRREALADRALWPSLKLGEDGALHLSFLQPSVDGYAVIYVRREADRFLQEEVGRTPYPVGPVLTLAEGRPVVTWVDDRGAVTVSRADERLVFDARQLPEALLGTPPAPPTALARRGDRLLALRPAEDGATVGTHTVSSRRAAGLLILAEVGETPDAAAVAWLPEDGAEAVSLGDDAAVVVSGGVPAWVTGLRADPRAEVPVAGRAAGGTLAGRHAVFAAGGLQVAPLPPEAAPNP